MILRLLPLAVRNRIANRTPRQQTSGPNIAGGIEAMGGEELEQSMTPTYAKEKEAVAGKEPRYQSMSSQRTNGMLEAEESTPREHVPLTEENLQVRQHSLSFFVP